MERPATRASPRMGGWLQGDFMNQAFHKTEWSHAVSCLTVKPLSIGATSIDGAKWFLASICGSSLAMCNTLHGRPLGPNANQRSSNIPPAPSGQASQERVTSRHSSFRRIQSNHPVSCMKESESLHSMRIESAECYAEIDPSRGRVLAFGPAGGGNALWTNPDGTDVAGWRNFGGEKLWFWPQDAWASVTGANWPPPFDGTPWNSRAGDNWVEWEHSLAPVLPATIVRRASVAANTLSVRSETRGTIAPLRLWSIAQVPRPEHLEIFSTTDRISPGGTHCFQRQTDGWSLRTCPRQGGKWYFDGDGIATVLSHI